MKKSFVVVTLAIAAVALPASAFQTSYQCTGIVTLISVNQAGSVVVAGPGGLPPALICSMGGTANFSADACKAAYATLLAAKLSGQSATVAFTDNLTCSTQPAWGSTGFTSATGVALQQ